VLTVVVPCAGIGSRFGAVYPKELHAVRPGITLLDLALAPVVELSKLCELQVVIVTSVSKPQILTHMGGYSDRFDFACVIQPGGAPPGLSSAIRAAVTWCSEDALIVLPDQVLEKRIAKVLREMYLELRKGRSAVLAEPCRASERLRTEGALFVSSQAGVPTVERSWEKPRDPSGFNSVWASIAVRRSLLQQLAEEIEQGSAVPSLIGARVFVCKAFLNVNSPLDLATYPSLDEPS